MLVSTYPAIIQAVLSALEAGYRLIDTASMYQNEEQIGKAIADSSVEREDIFVSSKYYPTRGYEDALNSFERYALKNKCMS